MAQKRKNKIQKLALFLGMMMWGWSNFSLPAFSAEADQTKVSETEKLPNFLPKDYKISAEIWGKWEVESSSNEDLKYPAPPTISLYFRTSDDFVLSNKVSIVVDVLHSTKWEIAHQAPFKLKTYLYILLQPQTGFTCEGEAVKLWFENGQSIEVPSDGDKYNACGPDEDRYSGGTFNLDNENKNYFKGVEAEYRLTSMIQNHKPVVLTQGKKVVLLKSLDEKPIKEYQEMVNPKLHPDYIEAIKKYYDHECQDPENIAWANGE